MRLSLPLLFLISSYALPILGYCIYNESEDNTFYWIRQIEGYGDYSSLASRFLAEHLRSGEKACCPYTNSDCNKTRGEKKRRVRFAFKRMWDGESGEHRELGTFEIDCAAGGYIIFGGNMNAPTIQVYWDDNVPYSYHVFEGSANMLNYAKYNSTTHNATIPTAE